MYPIRSILLAALKAGILSASINGLLFGAGKSMSLLPDDLIIPNANEPLTLAPVLLSSFIPPFVAGLLWFALSSFTKKTKSIFRVIAVSLLVLSYFTPFSIPGISPETAILLNLMHTVVAFFTVYFFQTSDRKTI
jgi:uncharacterized membrane protein